MKSMFPLSLRPLSSQKEKYRSNFGAWIRLTRLGVCVCVCVCLPVDLHIQVHIDINPEAHAFTHRGPAHPHLSMLLSMTFAPRDLKGSDIDT